MVAVMVFSGLTSAVCALASAAAIAAMLSLDLCMGCLHIRAAFGGRIELDHIEADGARLGTPTSHAMADRLLGVLGHESLQFTLGPLVVQECLPGAAEQACKLRPGVRRAHV